MAMDVCSGKGGAKEELALGQGSFGGDTRRDVAQNGRRGDDLHGIIPDWRDSVGDVDLPAILRPPHRLKGLDALTAVDSL